MCLRTLDESDEEDDPPEPGSAYSGGGAKPAGYRSGPRPAGVGGTLCGHKHASVTEIYADANHERAVEVMAKIG